MAAIGYFVTCDFIYDTRGATVVRATQHKADKSQNKTINGSNACTRWVHYSPIYVVSHVLRTTQ